MYYGRKWRAWTAALALSIMLVIVAVLQVVFVLVIRGPYSRGVSWPVTTFGIIACIVLISGYVPVPFELVKRRGRVVGVDLLFLLIDSSGALFSLMSLGKFKEVLLRVHWTEKRTQLLKIPLMSSLVPCIPCGRSSSSDRSAILTDGSGSCAIEYGMFISHGVWLFRTRGIRARAKEAQLSFDEFPEAIAWQDNGFKLPKLKWLRREKPTTESELEEANHVG